MCWEAGQESCRRPSDNEDIPNLGSAQHPSLEAPVCQALTPGEAKEATVTEAAWSSSPTLSLRATRRLQWWVRSARWARRKQEQFLSLLGSKVTGIWQPGKWELPVAASELRLSAGTQAELAAHGCQSCDFPGQFLLQDTRWGWISQYI